MCTFTCAFLVHCVCWRGGGMIVFWQKVNQMKIYQKASASDPICIPTVARHYFLTTELPKTESIGLKLLLTSADLPNEKTGVCNNRLLEGQRKKEKRDAVL